jgi:preprotein translocase subunit SecD
MRGRVVAAFVAGSLVFGFMSGPSSAARPSARHRFRFLAVLAIIPPLSSVNRASGSGAAVTQAVKSCGLAQVTAAAANGVAIPTTAAAGAASTNCQVLPIRNGETRLLLAPLTADVALGTPAGLSGRDVRTARASVDAGIGNTIDLTLTQTGAAKFNALAATQFGRPSPRDEVAAVVDGLVYAAPAFQSPSFSGFPQITGDFTPGEAKSLAIWINASRAGG